MGLGKVPKIVWGDALGNTLEFGDPLDRPVAYPEPREGSEYHDLPAGERDAWVVGENEVLQGEVGWIPTSTGTAPNGLPKTGWDGATGWAAFLKWARPGRVFRFYPDRDVASYVESYLLAPLQGSPTREPDDSRRIRLRIRSKDDSAYTGY